MTSCLSCGCPTAAAREACPWCESPINQAEPVSFVLEHSGDHYTWSTDGTVVAAATSVHGLWQIVDAQGHHVVTLMPGAPSPADDPAGVTLVGPTARVLGTICRGTETAPPGNATARDDDGRAVLVHRVDGPTGSHMVDRQGEVVAVSSWGEQDGITDLLVTSSGTRQPLAMVFGLVLATELYRSEDRRLA